MNLCVADSESPVRLRLERHFTDQELADFCADNEPLRIERDASGELIVMSPTLSDGGGIETDVLIELGIWARGDGRGKCFGSNSGFTLADNSMRAADAAWILWDRWNALTTDQQHSFARLCPDFIIEDPSASDRLKDLREKMAVWIANGAQEAWLIDPERKMVEVYRPGEETEFHANPSSVQAQGPVRGFELVMSRVWG